MSGRGLTSLLALASLASIVPGERRRGWRPLRVEVDGAKRIAGTCGRVRYRKRVRVDGRKVAVVTR